MVKSKKIYNIPNILCQNVITGHDSPIEAIILQEGKIFSGSRLGIIKIWDLYTGSNIKTLTGHIGTINSLAIKDNLLVSGGTDKTVRIWNIHSGECIKTLEGHTMAVLSVSIQGNVIASGSDDSTIIIWDKNTGEIRRTLNGHSRSVSDVKLYGDKLYSVSWDHYLQIWDLNTGESLNKYEEHFDAINRMAISDEYVITGDQTGYINIWDRTKELLVHHIKPHRLAVMGLKIDKNYLYSTSKDRTVKITDINTGICVKKLEGHRDATVGVDKSDNFLVSSSADKMIRVWNDFSLHSIHTLKAHEGIILGTKSHGNTLISAGVDNVLKVWDIKEGILLKTINLEVDSWIWGLAFDGHRIIASGDDGVYRLYDLNTGAKIQEFRGHVGKVYRTEMKGNRLITSGWDNTSRVWDIDSGECIHILKGHTYAVYSSVITEDEHYITGSSDGTIRIWDNNGNQVNMIEYHQDEVFHLETQGDLVVSASGDGVCGVFNYKTGETVALFDDHTDQVWTVLIHNNLVITGSADNTIKIWSLDTKECLDTLEGHEDNVKDLAISGHYLVSGALDSYIRIWDIRKYLDDKQETDEQISIDLDVLASQIQMARTYDMIPKELGDPGLTRILYGLNPLSPDTVGQHEKFVLALKEFAKSWYNLGKIGYAPWLSAIPRGIENGSIPMDDNETLDIILQEFMNGFRENGDLFWMGLLRRYGNRLESLLPEKWSFTLDFSGQGPSPLDGYEWHRLGSRLNTVELDDREETALIFRLTFQKINEWILPLIKAFEIQIKDDRGDVSYMNFSNFHPDINGNWYSTAMFKIDAGYKMEPNAMLFFTDINVIYESMLAPSFQGTNVLKELSIIRRENENLTAKVDVLQQQLVILSENISSCDFGEILPKKKKIEKTILPGYQLKNMYTSPKAKKIFQRIEGKYQEPAVGTLKVKIGQKFNKYLEHIQPKFILFTSATSITSAILLILLYISGFTGLDLLGNEFEISNEVSIPIIEIVLYILIYGFLIFILITSTFSWLKYQVMKQRRKNFE